MAEGTGGANATGHLERVFLRQRVRDFAQTPGILQSAFEHALERAGIQYARRGEFPISPIVRPETNLE